MRWRVCSVHSSLACDVEQRAEQADIAQIPVFLKSAIGRQSTRTYYPTEHLIVQLLDHPGRELFRSRKT